jgi:hypothetical protein
MTKSQKSSRTDLQPSKRTLELWLKANVKICTTPEVVTLSDFEINVDRFAGTFRVSLDEQVINEEFRFEIGGNGLPSLGIPLFCSPLGVPASFAAVELTTDTKNAIESVLANLFPQLRPFGLHEETREWITQSTPTADRILEPEKLMVVLQAARSKTFRMQIAIGSGKIV